MAWKPITGAVVGSGIAQTLTAVAAPMVLPAIGCSTGGVVAGSVMAATQLAIDKVAWRRKSLRSELYHVIIMWGHAG